MNKEYVELIKLLFGSGDKDYVVLGSAATLAYSATTGYERKMHDLDIVADEKIAQKIKAKLLRIGFAQSTFVNKRMPFFGKLAKHSKSYYLRFSKKDVHVEVLSTRFDTSNGKVKFNLYPNIWVQIPEKFFVQTSLNSSKFTTLDVNLLWATKRLIANLIGRKMTYKSKQFNRDLHWLGKLVDRDLAQKYLSECRLGYKKLVFRIPKFFLK